MAIWLNSQNGNALFHFKRHSISLVRVFACGSLFHNFSKNLIYEK